MRAIAFDQRAHFGYLCGARERLAVHNDGFGLGMAKQIVENGQERARRHSVLGFGVIEIAIGEDGISNVVAIEHSCTNARCKTLGQSGLAGAGQTDEQHDPARLRALHFHGGSRGQGLSARPTAPNAAMRSPTATEARLRASANGTRVSIIGVSAL